MPDSTTAPAALAVTAEVRCELLTAIRRRLSARVVWTDRGVTDTPAR